MTRSSEPTAAAPKRPAAVRQETDWILSYYQQAGTEPEVDNDGDQLKGARRVSTPSTTSSDSNSAYSIDGDEPPTSPPMRTKLSEQARELTEDDLGSPSSHSNRPRDDGERRNAGRRPSELYADRRRIAVIELDPVPPLSARRGQRPSIINTTTASSHQPRSSNTRFAKKSAGFAFVAPPDASPAAYTNLTPPSSAPAHITTINCNVAPEQESSKHKRSVSDVLDTRLSPRKSPRDVGIVGQLDDLPSITRKTSDDIQSYFDIQGSKAPVFQTPHRSPMPSPIPESVTTSTEDPPTSLPCQLTPEIGQAKDIHKPVVGPVVVDVDGAVRERSGPLLTPSFSPSVPSSYLFYQPGVHSVAGPPPPPIVRPGGRGGDASLMSPPPRPPRMHTPAISSSASNSNLRHAREQSSTLAAAKPPQLSPTTSGDSASRDPGRETPGSVQTAASDIVLESPTEIKPFHTREGAFPPSTTGSLSPTLPPELTLENSVSSTVSSSPSNESIPPPTPHKDDPLPVPARSLSRSSTSTSRSNPPHPPRSRPVSMHTKLTEFLDVPSNLSGSFVIAEKPLPSLAIDTSNSKRFSALPRAPSISRANLSHAYSRTPSPLPPKHRKRTVEQWPVAMQYKDIFECKTSLERSLGYARKINELAMYDCGLTSWMDAVRTRALPKKPSSQTNSKPGPNRGRHNPSSYKEPPEERKVSRDSFESGTTFPMRPDAYTATDLSMKTNDFPTRVEDLVTKAPVLPYPSLAPMTRSMTQNSTFTSPPSSMKSLPIPLPLSASKSTGGFFSSIGRKASIRKDREKGPPSPGKTLAKRTETPPQQKSIQLPQTSTPHVVGGPRAIPGRSHSIVAQPVPRPDDQKRVDPKRRSTVSGKRPSLYPPPPNKSMPPPSNTNAHNAHHVSMPPTSHQQGQNPGQIMPPDAQFNVQLDKLVHLLPRADRNVLAGYLRRSGQDILAVGRYLEDEKNGTIMYR
ncbi:hypothetical protein BJ322DRAFT_331530 [Thelephora terrestris]|uniref:Uncharacterized protein n=1 Tax=Thelephora terrestris TaxID=56493 RepID=A0A9P6H7T3_9AGAM|nr:hypothetical protein BJ322DRAFT_331530 [Thelephora terrestris]